MNMGWQREVGWEGNERDKVGANGIGKKGKWNRGERRNMFIK